MWDLLLMAGVLLAAVVLTKLRKKYPSFQKLFQHCYVSVPYVRLENSGLLFCAVAALFEIGGEVAGEQFLKAIPGLFEVAGCLMLIPYTYHDDSDRVYCRCIRSELFGMLGVVVMMVGSGLEVFMSGRWWALHVKGDDQWNTDDQSWQKSAVCELVGFGLILFEFNVCERSQCNWFFERASAHSWRWGQHFLGVLGILILCLASVYELLYGLYGACSTENDWWWAVSGVVDIFGLTVLSCAAVKGEDHDEDEHDIVYIEYVAPSSNNATKQDFCMLIEPTHIN